MTLLQPIKHFEGTRKAARPMARVETVRAAAKALRADMLAGPKVRFYKTFELVRVPYPSKYAYLNAFAAPTPFVHLCNRLFVIQFDSSEGVKTLLVSPSDWQHQRETPFFANLDARAGRFAPVMESLIFRGTATVLDCLASIGMRPEEIDYITYDHLHTQNVTRWLGGNGQAALFPNARLLIMREEWEGAMDLLPWDKQWYCPNGTAGVPADKVILLDDSVLLGDGAVALVRTKGHTEGNHSIVAHTDDGLLVTSENGVSLDAYEPKYSKIPGLAAYAKQTGAEIIINGNTQEYVVDQYISMVLEKTLAGANPADERFPNMMPSSETQSFWLFPGTSPTLFVGDRSYGSLVPLSERGARASAKPTAAVATASPAKTSAAKATAAKATSTKATSTKAAVTGRNKVTS